jgi:hypothetical protein
MQELQTRNQSTSIQLGEITWKLTFEEKAEQFTDERQEAVEDQLRV